MVVIPGRDIEGERIVSGLASALKRAGQAWRV
jgi:hypothetical protein